MSVIDFHSMLETDSVLLWIVKTAASYYQDEIFTLLQEKVTLFMIQFQYLLIPEDVISSNQNSSKSCPNEWL